MSQTPQMAPPSLDPPCCKEPRCSVGKSLKDIMRQHAGTSLFVPPMYWKDIHSKLLGVRFVELPPCTTPSPASIPGSAPSHGHLRPSRAIESLCQALTALLSPHEWDRDRNPDAVLHVLERLWPCAVASQGRAMQHIFYGDRVYRDVVSPQRLWNYPQDGTQSAESSFGSASTCEEADSDLTPSPEPPGSPGPHNPAGLPMICYIAKDELAFRRKNLFRRALGRRGPLNSPVRRLLQRRIKALEPANPNHDPVFVAIFLGMAQRHFYQYSSPYSLGQCTEWWFWPRAPPKRPPFEDICLRILTHDSETAEFIVYTGHVTASFLDRFYYPSRAPPEEEQASSGMKIEYTRVPIWPILGLRERLGKALGEEIVGPFDATRMETWETAGGVVADEVQSSRRRSDDAAFNTANANPDEVQSSQRKSDDAAFNTANANPDEAQSTERKGDEPNSDTANANPDEAQSTERKGDGPNSDTANANPDQVQPNKRRSDDAASNPGKANPDEQPDGDKETPLPDVKKRRRLPDGSPVKVTV
ncbi:hypothetical protein E4U43_001272 [Claviceps pusilla]|uniref:Uncharacterized protein n=1 Tax=Claviceps pusilla TaxID=123648 RepID=A0A9P7NA40_9HYPO|nr:hypothetical protein E4U43_001272 [Claviceps pusilla]